MFERHSATILELLKRKGSIRPAELDAVWQESRDSGRSFADALVERRLLTLAELLAVIADALGCVIEVSPPQELTAEQIALIPSGLARKHGVVPLRKTSICVEVLAADPFDSQGAADLGFILGTEVRVVVADPRIVQRLLAHAGSALAGPPPSKSATSEPSATDLAVMAEQPPVIQFVNRVLGQAIRAGASDIHFEPFEHELKIRCRIDGTLHDVEPPAREWALPIASRIKVMAGLDIAERRLPQDGRIQATESGRTVDLRVSTLPTQFGESVVLRVLDQATVQLVLDRLGMPKKTLAEVKELLQRPSGLFLVTGPTGSGKTTTLYSGLRALNLPGLKLLTAEDPVEYEIEGIMQVAINPVAGLTFASAMRAFLRQDPDVIMVGEIRDGETARIALQAALTGHLVLATLHTIDAPSAVTRLLDLGAEPFLVAATVEGVLAQRLLRRICPDCREAGADAGSFQGRGCRECRDSGYRGRLGIYEWMPMTDALRGLVTGDVSALELMRRARAQGFTSLREHALAAVRAGETTLDEALRHT